MEAKEDIAPFRPKKSLNMAQLFENLSIDMEKLLGSQAGDVISVVIPAGLVARWERQMQTPYDKLPYDEQESDRREGRRVLSLKWLDQEEKHVI